MREILNCNYMDVITKISGNFLVKNKKRSRFYLTNKAKRDPAVYLSSRERTIMSQLIDAGDVNLIADNLNLSPCTIKFYCKTIKQKILLLNNYYKDKR